MQELRRLIQESRNYILLAAIIFVLGTWLGFVYSDAFAAIINQMLEELSGIVEDLQEKSANPLYIAWFIFQNNVRAALVMLGMGFLLFFVPAFSLFANGLAVGFVIQMSAVEAGLSPWAMFAFGILPHGILELPAVIVAGGMGMFLGLRLLRWLFGRNKFFAHLFGSPRDGSIGSFWREDTLPVIQQRGKGLLALVLSIIVVLFAAALIESFITPVLMYYFIDMPL